MRAVGTKKKIAVAAIVIMVLGGVVAMGARHWSSTHGTAQPTAAASITDKSIAVLPFTDVSEKKDQEYFADGMASEIIDLLASVPALRVIGSASSFRFRSSNPDVREIARGLNVRYIAEGSVSRSGTRLRITGRLVDGRDGRQVWSASYDRDGSEILAVQSELAQAFARGLEVATDASAFAVVSESGTRRPDAYDEYLRARHAYDRFDQEGMQEAAAHLARAIEFDPKFVRAIELLALVQENQVEWGFVPAADGFARAGETSARALQLNPNSAWGHLVRQRVAMLRDFQWDVAEREFQEALRLAPHDPAVLVSGASLACVVGRTNEAIRLGLESLVSDPLYPVGYIVLGWTYYRAGMLDKAESAFRRVLQLSPSYASVRLNLSKVLLAQGRFEDALAVAKEETPEEGRDEGLAMAYFALGRKSDSNEALSRLIRDGANFSVAQVYAYRGETDLAISWFEKAYANRDVDLYLVKGELALRKIESNARYKAFLRKMNLPD
jgi:TolB-like protein/Flp pilus assembly protein TadD